MDLPGARAFGDPDVNKWIDTLLREDEMHYWLSKDTNVLKNEIRNGIMQKSYEKFFNNQ